MSLDAMKQALDALESNPDAMVDCGGGHWDFKRDLAITALRAAIEQAQEPVAWVYQEWLEALKSGRLWTAYGSSEEGRIPLYLNDAVAQRVEPPAAESGAGFESLPASPQWQGLTDKEIENMMDYWSEPARSAYGGAHTANGEYVCIADIIRDAEAKLKEKNK